VDPPETNKSFAQTLGLDYPLLSDPTKKVAKAYGVVDEDQSFAARWTFYIGVDGRILYIDKQVSPAAHGKEIAARLAELGVPRRRAGSRVSQQGNGSAVTDLNVRFPNRKPAPLFAS
jgi:peroxiredoxin Q/BCP